MFYSIRTFLEEGRLTSTDRNNEFYSAIVTMYPCLDLWVEYIGSNEYNVRVMFIQCDPEYVADPNVPATRDGEKPKVWKQLQGDFQTIRSTLLASLPALSRLNDEKRHGLSNFGNKQPYDGYGLLFKVEGNDLVVFGRFGILRVEVDGNDIPVEDFIYEFDCCDVTVTVRDVGDGDISVSHGGGRGTNYIDGRDTGAPTGSFNFTSAVGYADVEAPYYTTSGFLSSQRGHWAAGVASSMPLGAPASINAPTFENDPGYGFSVSGPWPGLNSQSSCLISGICPLVQQSENVYTGRLRMPTLLYVKSEFSCLLEFNGTVSILDQDYHSSVGGETSTHEGTLQVNRIPLGGDLYSYVTSWTADDPAGPNVGFNTSSIVTSNSQGMEAYLTAGSGSILGASAAYNAHGLSNNNYVVSSYGITVDTEGFRSTPPVNADYPLFTPVIDTQRWIGQAWRNQVQITLA